MGLKSSLLPESFASGPSPSDDVAPGADSENNGVVSDDDPLTMRRAQPGDALDVAAVHIASWQVAYRGLVSSEFLDALDVDERASRYDFGERGPETWIATQDNVVVGLLTLGRCRDGDHADAGEVWGLYVAPTIWRSGIGTRLLAKGEELLAQRDHTEATLWVLEGNAQARHFYERAGWRFDGTRQTVPIGGRDLSEVRYVKILSSE
jgi:ribosomal protein S18 acetylase RimI-like enzyme